nr:PREDICTED: phospholipase A1-like [Megachile rotundata]
MNLTLYFAFETEYYLAEDWLDPATNMKVHVQLVLLFLGAIMDVSGDSFLGFGLSVDIYFPDSYNNYVKDQLVIFDSHRNTSESNYPNTILFYLYTKYSRDDFVRLYVNDIQTLKNSPFDVKKPTVFITHGLANSYQSPVCTYIREAYNKHGDYNIIVIDWAVIASGGPFWVSRQVAKVAKYATRMIDFLESQGMDPSTTTIVGHSFGAHLAGLTSYYAKKKMNYVVGLDPAGPNFYLEGKGTRLSKDDATYVQVIHTSILYGLFDPLGHADFYVHGGRNQPGCELRGYCSHFRAYEVFAESVNTKGFIARKCENYMFYMVGLCDSNQSVYMGGVTPDYNAQGIYYLDTNSKPPFAMNSPDVKSS